MSGFEVAGVVHAAIPLVISSLEHYRSGKGAASAFVKWHGHLDKLIFRLKLQQTLFYLDTLDLLRGANVEEIEDRVHLTEAECAAVLADAKTGDRGTFEDACRQNWPYQTASKCTDKFSPFGRNTTTTLTLK